MADLSLYLTTFNCGRAPISTDFFAANLFNALTTNLPPDLVVLSLQEIAPLGYSFLGGSSVAPYLSRFGDAVRNAAEAKFGGEVEYETVVVRNVGMTALALFARREVAERIRWVRSAGVGVGVWEMGNKGAVGVRIAMGGTGADEEDEVLLTFVAAHLAPMEEAWERRNEDWNSICESLVFESHGGGGGETGTLKTGGDEGAEAEPLLNPSSNDSDQQRPQTLFSPPTHLFFLGDLNYRSSDHAPSPTAHETWPQPTTSTSDQHHYAHLLASDQLTRERRANHTLHHLSEAPVAFPPTYKYSAAAQKHAAHAAARQALDDDEVWLWAKHRTPSWCDRVLFLAAAEPKVHAYDALPVQPTSDHRPVALSCSVPWAPMTAKVKSPFAIRQDWRERRAAARRYELLVGAAAYLGWTWEGEAVLLGTLVGLAGGYLLLWSLRGWA